jgi:CubicO group peptidase (beta-lactamase class C family)
MKKSRLLCLFLLVSTACISQTLQDTIALIDKAMSIYLPENPGSQLSIKKNGKIIFSKAYGNADLEHNVPLTLTSKIEAGSVSKQFTAAAILLLEQQGKLSLNDDVRKYIPELPDYGNMIKLEQMMHHTSGLKDWGEIAGLAGWGRTTKNYTNDDALNIIIAQKTLNNIPGAEYIYSNSNYNLFAIIVERVSRQSLAAFTKQHIFIPAGMTNTEWRDDHNRIVKDRAIAYSKTENGYQTLMPNEDAYGNGGLLTTTEDLLKWNDFYQSGKLGTPSLLSKQTQTKAFHNGKINDYGAGLHISKFKRYNQIVHEGATAGYRAYLETFPELDFSVAFLSNTSQFDGSKIRLNNTIRDIFISGDESPETDKNNPAVNVSETLLHSYAGWYKNDRTGAGFKMELKDKNLFFNNAALVPQSESTFKNGQALIEINNQNGSLNAITKTDIVSYSKVETPTFSKEYLDHYTGKYFSTETNSTIIITQKDGKLLLKLKSNNEFQLNPTYRDAFTISDYGGNLYFIKNKKKKTTGMKISQARARNIEFVKLE